MLTQYEEKMQKSVENLEAEYATIQRPEHWSSHHGSHHLSRR